MGIYLQARLLYPEEGAFITHWIGVWVSFWAGLDAAEKR
jgi:hypothetical protein